MANWKALYKGLRLLGSIERAPSPRFPWAISEPRTRPLHSFTDFPASRSCAARAFCRNAQVLNWLPSRMHNPRYYAKQRRASPPPPSSSGDDFDGDDDLPFAYDSDDDDMPVPMFTSSDDDDSVVP